MKSGRMAIGMAAAMAVAGVGFEARAQGVTRAECEVNAARSYSAGVQRCSQRPWYEYANCRMFELTLYYEQMNYCAQITTTPRGGKAPPISTSAPGGLDGWFNWF